MGSEGDDAMHVDISDYVMIVHCVTEGRTRHDVDYRRLLRYE